MLISSNPDFVIIRRQIVETIIGKIKPNTEISKDIIQKITENYRLFEDKCELDDIKGYISVKFSLRPDRRLQIPHEGSLMKAIYTHIQTREWIINPQGIRYYALAADIGQTDREALKTVATYSITTVHSIPQAAVDEVFQVNSIKDAYFAFHTILGI